MLDIFKKQEITLLALAIAILDGVDCTALALTPYPDALNAPKPFVLLKGDVKLIVVALEVPSK